MDAQVSQQFSLEEQLKQLEEGLRNGKASAEDYREAINSLGKALWKIQELLEWATERRDDKDLSRLYRQVAGYNASSLIDKLRGLGYRYKKDDALSDALGKQGYRLLEQTRAGKREDVFYGLLRIFISLKREVPPMLVEAFKPIYSDEIFKVFVFSFLSGVLGREEE
jgi:hypothetical protein